MKESAPMKEPAAAVKKETLQASCRPVPLPRRLPPLLTYYTLTTNLHSILTYYTLTTHLRSID